MNTPQILSDFQRVIESSIRDKLKSGSLDVSELSEAVVKDIAAEFGGMQFYIPLRFFSNRERALAIFRDWGKRTPDELVKEHGVCVKHVYKLYRYGRKLDMANRQLDLFTTNKK